MRCDAMHAMLRNRFLFHLSLFDRHPLFVNGQCELKNELKMSVNKEKTFCKKYGLEPTLYDYLLKNQEYFYSLDSFFLQYARNVCARETTVTEEKLLDFGFTHSMAKSLMTFISKGPPLGMSMHHWFLAFHQSCNDPPLTGSQWDVSDRDALFVKTEGGEWVPDLERDVAEEEDYWYHATSVHALNSILKKGISPSCTVQPTLGRGFYVCNSRTLAKIYGRKRAICSGVAAVLMFHWPQALQEAADFRSEKNLSTRFEDAFLFPEHDRQESKFLFSPSAILAQDIDDHLQICISSVNNLMQRLKKIWIVRYDEVGVDY